VTGGVVVAYMVDGRLKMPKGAAVFDIGDAEVTGQPEPAAEPVRQRLPVPSNPDQDPVAPAATTPTAAPAAAPQI
jgi:hypothetical protein